MKWRKKTLTQTDDPFKEKIENCSNERSLLQLLMSIDSKKFATDIEILENALYGNAKINLKKVKQEISEKL